MTAHSFRRGLNHGVTHQLPRVAGGAQEIPNEQCAAAVASTDFATLRVGDAVAIRYLVDRPSKKGRHGMRAERPFGTSVSSPQRHMVIGSVMGCGKKRTCSRASGPLGESRLLLI
jgi:hypothetical protein